MFANDDNEKTIKTYASLLQDIREGKTIGVDIDHTGGPDDNAKMHNITIKKSQMDGADANSHDAIGSKENLKKYLAKHYDSTSTAKKLHPEIYM